MTVNKKRALVALLILYIGFIIFDVLYRGKNIEKNKAMACGQVKRIHVGAHSSRIVYYSFYVNGQQIENSNGISALSSYRNLDAFVGKYFVVVFDSTNTSDSRIIILKEYIENYNVSIEDWNRCTDTLFHFKMK